MNARMLTLFGEEEIITPEALVGAPKAAAKTTQKQKKNSESGEEAAISTVLMGWKATKQYYTIGEVAELFSVRTSHIRFWTNEFELKVRTTRKGDRLYSPAIINELRTIYHLVKERGFTIVGAKAKLKEGSKASVDTLDLKQSLLKLRNQLLLIRNNLQ